MALNTAVTDTRWSPNFSKGRPSGSAAFIVIHHWGADGQTHQGVVDYLCRTGGNSSAHYVASGGRVTQLVHDYDRAWHAGSAGNPRGIGVECRPEMSDADFETVARLVAAIRAQHGNLPLRGHKDYMSTACPGRWYARLGDLDARARQIAGGTTDAPAAPAASSGGFVPLDVDGDWGPATGARFRQVMGLPTNAPWKDACRALQYFLTWALDAYTLERVTGSQRLVVDGVDRPATIKAFQEWWNRSGIPEGHRIAVDGLWGPETYMAMQITLNYSWAGSRGLACMP